MRVDFHYFAQVRASAEKETETLEVSEEATVLEAILSASEHHQQTFRDLLFEQERKLRGSVVVLLDGQPVPKPEETPLREGQEISLLTAVAGG
jgi:molybdopterin converting factor small subunit